MHARFLLAGLPLLSVACALPSLEVQGRYASLEIDGKVNVSGGGIGAGADLEQAGLDDDQSLGGRLDFEFGSPHLIVLAQAPRFEGTGTLDVTLDDGTNTIAAGSAVSSKIDLEMYDAALVFDLVPGDMVEVALGFGAAWIDMAVLFEEVGTGTTVASAEAFPLPLLALSAAVWIGPVEVGAFAGGMQYELDDDELSYFDLDVFARWKFFGLTGLRGSLIGGYRMTQVDVEYDDDATVIDNDLTIAGPFFGLALAL